MCDFENGFSLCTCVHLTKREKKIITNQYEWVLFSFIEKITPIEIGLYSLPKNVIGNGFTAEFVLSNLNAKNCFDFEYTPKEGDNLMIKLVKKKEMISYLSFIYKNEKWTENHYDAFSTLKKQIFKGKIKTNPL